jgi:hypothetical protein
MVRVIVTYDDFDGGFVALMIGNGFVSNGCNRAPGVSDCVVLVDFTSLDFAVVLLLLLSLLLFIEDMNRTYVDPMATPNPDAILADLQPFPDLNNNIPIVPPISTPAVIFITPSSI